MEREILKYASEIFSNAYKDVTNCADHSVVYFIYITLKL